VYICKQQVLCHYNLCRERSSCHLQGWREVGTPTKTTLSLSCKPQVLTPEIAVATMAASHASDRMSPAMRGAERARDSETRLGSEQSDSGSDETTPDPVDPLALAACAPCACACDPGSCR
jgi:hypothetical protein